jgi:hypothetical protein
MVAWRLGAPAARIVLAIVAMIAAMSAHADDHLSMTAPPDVCIASNVAAGFALRADNSGLQIRVINSKWSLPTGVNGAVRIDVGAFHKSFDIDDNTDNSVNAELSNDDALALFAAMDNAGIMSVTAGTAKAVAVSLVGSTKATNAFRTCAGLDSSGPGGGVNPFK